jgi:hypothetical protein
MLDMSRDSGRRLTVVFTLNGEDAIILRILYAGRSLDLAFD